MISDTGTSWLALPADQFNALVTETGAQYNFWQDIYTVDCDAKGLPDLVFTIGGKKYSVSSKEYVLDVSGNSPPLMAFRRCVRFFLSSTSDFMKNDGTTYFWGPSFSVIFCFPISYPFSLRRVKLGNLVSGLA